MTPAPTTSPADLEARARALLTDVPGTAADALPPWLEAHADARGLGPFIDHTLLRPEATRDQIARLCDEGAEFGVKAVCVNGAWVGFAAERLRGSGVRVATVVGFPLGAMTTEAKAAETRIAVADGAEEVDMVLGLGDALGGEWELVRRDVRAVVEAAGSAAAVKVILESAALDRLAVAKASIVSREAGAAFVKTSTGFHAAGGASTEAVSLMRRAMGPDLGVKASGGVRTAEAAIAMLAAGASRIGTSGTAAMREYLGPRAAPIGDILAQRERERR